MSATWVLEVKPKVVRFDYTVSNPSDYSPSERQVVIYDNGTVWMRSKSVYGEYSSYPNNGWTQVIDLPI